jgi:ribulose bisphosphate carboxylase small subunit
MSATVTTVETPDGWDVKVHNGEYVRVVTQDSPKKITVIVAPDEDEAPLKVTLGVPNGTSA